MKQGNVKGKLFVDGDIVAGALIQLPGDVVLFELQAATGRCQSSKRFLVGGECARFGGFHTSVKFNAGNQVE